MRTASVFGIHPEAMPAWVSLGYALDRMADQGQQPVCHQRPDQWSQDAKPYARRDAVEACAYCPIENACGAFADANRESGGVWGGHDYSDSLKMRCTSAATTPGPLVATSTPAGGLW